MKEFNLYRLIDTSPFINQFDNDERDAIADYFIDGGYDLNDINIDDFIVNGIYRIEREEWNEKTEEQKEDCYILYNDEDRDYLLVLN